MLATIHESKAALEANGLHVSWNNSQSLLIAARYREVGYGIRLSNDACILMCDGDKSIASFPGKGLSAHDVPGSLADLVPLILAVYEQYNADGQGGTESFRIAVEQVLDQPAPVLEQTYRHAV